MSDVTIYTLAKELNMTPSMVSRAFNPNAKISEEKRQIVLKTAQKYHFSPNKFASRLSMKTVRIGVIINSRFQINAEKMIAGIKDAYAELKDYKIEYDVSLLHPSKNTHEELCQAMERYKSYDGVILTGMSSSNYTSLINDLYTANPNVVQVQAINQDANYLFASKHNEKTASQLAAEFLYNCLKKAERKNVLLFIGDKESALHSRAQEFFKAACENLGLTLLSTVDMKDNEEYFQNILPDVFQQYAAQTDGIYITSGLSTALCRYLEQNRMDIPFVAFDTYAEIKRYIEKGVVSATIDQNVSKQIGVAFEMLVKHMITGEQCPKIVYTDVQLVLKSNMHQF